MSTPKFIAKNNSLSIKRDNSVRSVLSREKIRRGDEDFVSRKRFKIHPYSSFEDRFFEQEKINKFTWESINRIEEKISKIISSEDFLRFQQRFSVLEEKFNKTINENQNNSGFSAEVMDIKRVLHDKIAQDHKFRGRSNEKSKVLFEESVRIGKSLENCEKNISLLQEKIMNSTISNDIHLQATEYNLKFKELEDKFQSLWKFLATDKESISLLHQNSSKVKRDLEAFIHDLKSSFTLQLSQITEEIQKKFQIEGEVRLKDAIDIQQNLDSKSRVIYEKLSAEILKTNQDLYDLKKILENNHDYNLKSFNRIDHSVDQHLKELKTQIFEEHQSRIRLESQLTKKTEDIAKDLETKFKISQENLDNTVKKITDTFLCEIEARTQAERELKHIIEVATKDMLIDIHENQGKIEQLTNALEFKENELRTSISEKADILSRFIESEIQNIRENIMKDHEKSKKCIEDLGGSLKNNILKQEKLKSLYDENFLKIEKGIEEAKGNQIDLSKKVKGKIMEKIRKVQESTEKRQSSNTKILENRIEDFRSELQKVVENLYIEFDDQKSTNITLMEEFNNKLAEFSDHYNRNLEDVSSNFDAIEQQFQNITESEEKYKETLLELQTYIDLKTLNEKVLREHMVNYYKNEIVQKIQENGKVQDLKFDQVNEFYVGKTKKLEEDHKELSRAFDFFRENIKAEIEDYLENLNSLKEKIEVGEIVLEDLREKITGFQDQHSKVQLMFREFNRRVDSQYMKVSKNVVDDLTSRVEGMHIMEKMNLIFQEMESNEKETEAMLQLYKKEIEYIQDRQQKSLEEAQKAIFDIFGKKIADLEDLLVGEMHNAVEFITKRRPEVENLSGLQELAKVFKKN